MGRVSIPVDLVQVLALVWNHPLIAALSMLMFTPPFFPVLVFFSPLLISTALCAVALISMGQPIEDSSKRDREVTDLVVARLDLDLPAAEERAPVRRRGLVGEENWLDWVRKSLDPRSMWGQPEGSTFVEDVREEGLLSDFRGGEGGIDMKEEQYRPQVQTFWEIDGPNLGEKSFSFRTGAAVVASMDGLQQGDSSTEIVPFQENRGNAHSSNPRMNSMFHYTPRNGGVGAGRVDLGGRVSSRALDDSRSGPHKQRSYVKSLASSDLDTRSERFVKEIPRDYHPQTQPSQVHRQFSFRGGRDLNDGVALSVKGEPNFHHQRTYQQLGASDGESSAGSQVQEKEGLDQPQKQKQLLSFGSGIFTGTVVEKKENSEQNRSGELISFGSAFLDGVVEKSPMDEHQDHQCLQHEHGATLEKHMSTSFPVPSSNYLETSSSPSRNPGRALHADNMEMENRRTIDGVYSNQRDGKLKQAPERLKGLSHKSNVIPGNAVIYTAEPSPVDARYLQRRNAVSSRDQSPSASTSRQKRKHGMAARHALLMEKENSIFGSWMIPSKMLNSGSR